MTNRPFLLQIISRSLVPVESWAWSLTLGQGCI